MPSPDFGMSLMANFHKSPAFFTFSLNSIGDGELRVAAQEMFAAAASGTLKAIINDALPLANASEAHRRLEAGEVFGKLDLMT